VRSLPATIYEAYLFYSIMENIITYLEKLRSPKWQKKRLEILERDNFTCTDCGDNESTLNVHHKIYFSGKEPWEYENELLITLCENCHKQESENIKQNLEIVTTSLKKSIFLSHHWVVISEGIENCSHVHVPEVMASIISFALKDLECMKILEHKFFIDLGKKNTNTTNNPF
jgi:hypothetical protein